MNNDPSNKSSQSDVSQSERLSQKVKDRIFFFCLGLLLVIVAGVLIFAYRVDKQRQSAVALAVARIDDIFGDLAKQCDIRWKAAEQFDGAGRSTRQFVPWGGKADLNGDVLVLMRENMNSQLLPYAFDQLPGYALPQSTQHISIVVVIEKGYRVEKIRDYPADAMGMATTARDFVCWFGITQLKWPEMAFMRSVVVEGQPPVSGAMRIDAYGNEPWMEAGKFLAPLFNRRSQEVSSP